MIFHKNLYLKFDVISIHLYSSNFFRSFPLCIHPLCLFIKLFTYMRPKNEGNVMIWGILFIFTHLTHLYSSFFRSIPLCIHPLWLFIKLFTYMRPKNEGNVMIWGILFIFTHLTHLYSSFFRSFPLCIHLLWSFIIVFYSPVAKIIRKCYNFEIILHLTHLYSSLFITIIHVIHFNTFVLMYFIHFICIIALFIYTYNGKYKYASKTHFQFDPKWQLPFIHRRE